MGHPVPRFFKDSLLVVNMVITVSFVEPLLQITVVIMSMQPSSQIAAPRLCGRQAALAPRAWLGFANIPELVFEGHRPFLDGDGVQMREDGQLKTDGYCPKPVSGVHLYTPQSLCPETGQRTQGERVTLKLFDAIAFL
jgi:hypothetical protein